MSEFDKTIRYRIERRSIPSQAPEVDAKYAVNLAKDELKLDNPDRAAGGRTVIAWRRVK